MADRTQPLAKKVGDVSYLTKFVANDTSMQGMEQYVLIPFVKIIQAMTGTELKQLFGEGAAILRPGDALIEKCEAPFQFVPIFFCDEFAKWADRKDKESPMIVERSFRPDSVIAKKAARADTRFEPYPGQEGKADKDQWKYRYVAHLRFFGVIFGDHPLAGTKCVISFDRGEFTQGRNFITAIQMRRVDIDGEKVRVPLFAQVWQLYTKLRDRGEKKWIGFNFEVPEEGGIVPEDMVGEFAEEHEMLKRAHQDNILRVDGEDLEEETVVTDDM